MLALTRYERRRRVEALLGFADVHVHPWLHRRGGGTGAHTISVYIAVSRDTGLIKIGRSTKPAARAKSLHADLCAVLPHVGGDVEAMLHFYCAGLEVGGEWFTPSPHLMAVADRLNRAFPMAVVA